MTRHKTDSIVRFHAGHPVVTTAQRALFLGTAKASPTIPLNTRGGEDVGATNGSGRESLALPADLS